jgi:hypothetical protein
LEERILYVGTTVTPFTAMVTEHVWDTVCSLGPYLDASGTLYMHYGRRFSDYTYLPYNAYLNDQQNGLAFVNNSTKTVYVYPLSASKIRKIAGPTCIRRDEAFFNTEYVEAPNATFLQLNMIESQ